MFSWTMRAITMQSSCGTGWKDRDANASCTSSRPIAPTSIQSSDVGALFGSSFKASYSTGNLALFGPFPRFSCFYRLVDSGLKAEFPHAGDQGNFSSEQGMFQRAQGKPELRRRMGEEFPDYDVKKRESLHFCPFMLLQYRELTSALKDLAPNSRRPCNRELTSS